MELTEPAEEDGLEGSVEPTLADEGSTDEAGWEAESDHNLHEEVVIVKHLRDGSAGPAE